MSFQQWDPGRRPDDKDPHDPTHNWVRGIPQGSSRAPNPTQQQKRGWFEALGKFVSDEKTGLVPKILFRIIPTAYVPWGIINDVALPIVGAVDNIPTVVLAVYVAYKVNKYRNPANDK